MQPDTLFRLENRLARIEALLARPDRLAYTIEESAQSLGVCQATVRSWIRSGRLKACRTANGSGAWLVRVTDLEAALAPEAV